MLQDYLINHYVFLLATLGLIAMLITGGVRRDRLTGVMLMSSATALVLSVLAYTDIYISQGSVYHPVRMVCSVLSYILRPAIIYIYIHGFSGSRRVKRFCFGLLILNTAVFLMSFFTKQVVYVDTANNFHSPWHLNYLAYVVSAIMLTLLARTSIHSLRTGDPLESMLIGFLALGALGGALIDTFTDGVHYVLVNSIAVSNCLYFIFAYLKVTGRDTVTGLSNRSAFFRDSERRIARTASIISLDMNELKWINDTNGHDAGDEALRQTGEILLKNIPAGSRAYRTGGDEFCVVMQNAAAQELETCASRLRSALDSAGLSCAIGCAAHAGDFMKTVKAADESMYRDKARLRAEHEAGLNSIHFRR